MKSNSIDNKGDKLFSTFYKNPGKETIILLHGGPGVPMDFAEVINQLKDHYQLITFEQRGTKQSPCLSEEYSMEAYLSDIKAIAKYYKIDKFHLFGHSWGGLYAQIYAEKYPENLLSLFLISPSSGTNTQWKQTEKEVMQFNKAKCQKGEWLKMGWNSFLGMMGSDQAYQKLFKQVIKNYNIDFEVPKAPNLDLQNVKAKPINKTRPEIIKYLILKKQEAPNYPIAIVYGDNDIYGESMNFVINRYPTANLITIKNCGHLPWLHNPNDFNAALNQFYSIQ